MPDKGLDGVAAEPGVPKPDPVLVVDGVRKRFGGLVAVDVEHLEVQRGAITALIGPNGAGKTTLFNQLSGFDRPDAGTWSFDGRSLSGHSAHRTARAGMVRTFQLPRALSKMSVLDNVRLAATGQSGERMLAGLVPWRWRGQENSVTARAEAVLERFGLATMAGDYAGILSGGQRKLLEMARALMVEPRMLMLDEPMAGVNPVLTESLLHHITDLADGGMTVLFIEHDMDVVMGISDWVVCMAEGKVIAEGRPEDVASNPRVIDAYLGTSHSQPTSGGEG